MTEISSLEDSLFEELPLRDPFPRWEKAGRTLFYTSSIVAGFAFVPALVKKKRVFTPIAGAIPTAVSAVIEATQESTPRCLSEDAAKIREIFTTIATNSVWGVASNGFRLNTLGNELRKNNVHPFEFLRCAPKEHVQQIFREGNYFKIEGIMSGVREGMNRENRKGNLERFIPDFAAVMGKQATRIRPLIQACKWREIVDYLFDINGGHEQ